MAEIQAHCSVQQSWNPGDHIHCTEDAGQVYYDQLVQFTGCENFKDSLQCLRAIPTETFLAAVNSTPSVFNFTSLNLAWQPRIDGVLFKRNPQNLVADGEFAKVPLLAGDCQDEGTIFALPSTAVTTDAEFIQYIESNYFPGASMDELNKIMAAYPDDPSQGSPFGTGSENALTPQYKRLASILGDIIFQAPRRFLLQNAAHTENTWAYLYQRGSSTPFLGAFHGSDLAEFYGGAGPVPDSNPDFIGTDALIFFVSRLNPNSPNTVPGNISFLSHVQWEQWGSSNMSPPLLTFTDPEPSISFTADVYRANGMDIITSILRKLFP